VHWPLLLGVHLLIFSAMLFGTRMVKPADSHSWFSDWYAVGLLHAEWGTEFWIGPFAVAVACLALVSLLLTAISTRWALWRGDIVLFAGLLIGGALLIFHAPSSFEHVEHSVASNAIRITTADGATWVTREHQRGMLDWLCGILLIAGGSVMMTHVLSQPGGPRFSHLAVWVATGLPLGCIVLISVTSICVTGWVPGWGSGKLWQMLAAFFTSTCLIAMPFLGAIAAWQIKRSNGQLRGLRLAALEAIIVPLFLFAALVGHAVFWPVSCLVTMLITPHEFYFLATMDNPVIVILMVLFALCAALIAAFFTGRAVWRRIAGQPAAPAREHSDKPRLSRVALFGAMAPPLVLIFVAGLALIGRTFPADRGIAPADHPAPRSAFLAAIPMLAGPLAMMIAMTIFGIIAIRQIKQSGGKLCGLRLAAVDALLPPMILLLVLIGFLLYAPFARPEGITERSTVLFGVLLLMALLFCVFAINHKWRAIVGRKAAPPAPKVKPKVKGIFWLISRFPELDHLDPVEKAEVLDAMPWWTYPVIIFRASVVAMIMGGIAASAVWSITPLPHEAAPFFATFIVVALIVWMKVYIVNLSRLRGVIRLEIARAFRGQKPPFCFTCGYDLRATTGGACPECGSAISTGGAPASHSNPHANPVRNDVKPATSGKPARPISGFRTLGRIVAYFVRDPERWWVIAASVAIYAFSFFVPAVWFEGRSSRTGAQAFCDAFDYGYVIWIANPAVWIGWILLSFGRRWLAFIAGAIALVLSAWALINPGDVTPTMSWDGGPAQPIGQIHLQTGYACWLASTAIFAIGAFILAFRASRNAPAARKMA
jgi:hypothetical protein